MKKLFERRANFEIWDYINQRVSSRDILTTVNRLLIYGGTYISKDISSYLDEPDAEIKIKQLFDQGILLEGEDFIYFTGCEEYVEPEPKDPLKRSRRYLKHKDFVFDRDGYQCVYCGSSENLTLDHIIPITKGGSDDQDNLACCCKCCNSSKNDKLLSEWVPQIV